MKVLAAMGEAMNSRRATDFILISGTSVFFFFFFCGRLLEMILTDEISGSNVNECWEGNERTKTTKL